MKEIACVARLLLCSISAEDKGHSMSLASIRLRFDISRLIRIVCSGTHCHHHRMTKVPNRVAGAKFLEETFKSSVEALEAV